MAVSVMVLSMRLECGLENWPVELSIDWSGRCFGSVGGLGNVDVDVSVSGLMLSVPWSVLMLTSWSSSISPSSSLSSSSPFGRLAAVAVVAVILLGLFSCRSWSVS